MTVKMEFILSRYNPRRKARGTEAAEVQVLEDWRVVDLLWMSLADLRKNLKLYPDDDGLKDAIEAYNINKDYIAP